MSELIETNELHYTRVDGEPVVIVHEDTLKALYEAIRLAREALESVEWGDSYGPLEPPHCLWCYEVSSEWDSDKNIVVIVHSDTCKRDLALAALQGVTQ